MNIKRFYIGKVGISRVDINTTVKILDSYASIKQKAYLCVTNVHATYLSNNNPEFCEIQNSSTLTVPDGMPLIWLARLNGIKDIQKTSGLDLFRAICKLSEDRIYTHYFYGSSPDVLCKMVNNLKRLYPKIKILGQESPPFAPVEQYDIKSLIRKINTLNPTFLWVGLGAPKQEKMISMIFDELDSAICVGIGLAFEYAAGTVKRAPLWMQKTGLEWVVRVAQRPENLKRFFKPYLWLICTLITSFCWSLIHRAKKN